MLCVARLLTLSSSEEVESWAGWLFLDSGLNGVPDSHVVQDQAWEQRACQLLAIWIDAALKRAEKEARELARQMDEGAQLLAGAGASSSLQEAVLAILVGEIRVLDDSLQ